jgi:hypothetical protein
VLTGTSSPPSFVVASFVDDVVVLLLFLLLLIVVVAFVVYSKLRMSVLPFLKTIDQVLSVEGGCKL